MICALAFLVCVVFLVVYKVYQYEQPCPDSFVYTVKTLLSVIVCDPTWWWYDDGIIIVILVNQCSFLKALLARTWNIIQYTIITLIDNKPWQPDCHYGVYITKCCNEANHLHSPLKSTLSDTMICNRTIFHLKVAFLYECYESYLHSISFWFIFQIRKKNYPYNWKISNKAHHCSVRFSRVFLIQLYLI